MSALLAIDPGLKTVGWAYFEGRELRACGLSRARSADPGEAAAAHRANLEHFYELRVEVVAERMEHRARRRGQRPVPPQDLIDVNLIAGHLGATRWYLPRQWKGSVPKEIHQTHHILPKLSDTEKKLVLSVKPASLRHNAIDAVGIGLYRLGR